MFTNKKMWTTKNHLKATNDIQIKHNYMQKKKITAIKKKNSKNLKSWHKMESLIWVKFVFVIGVDYYVEQTGNMVSMYENTNSYKDCVRVFLQVLSWRKKLRLLKKTWNKCVPTTTHQLSSLAPTENTCYQPCRSTGNSPHKLIPPTVIKSTTRTWHWQHIFWQRALLLSSSYTSYRDE